MNVVLWRLTYYFTIIIIVMLLTYYVLRDLWFVLRLLRERNALSDVCTQLQTIFRTERVLSATKSRLRFKIDWLSTQKP